MVSISESNWLFKHFQPYLPENMSYNVLMRDRTVNIDHLLACQPKVTVTKYFLYNCLVKH